MLVPPYLLKQRHKLQPLQKRRERIRGLENRHALDSVKIRGPVHSPVADGKRAFISRLPDKARDMKIVSARRIGEKLHFLPQPLLDTVLGYSEGI